jgi:hypothetical protein
MEDMKSQIHAIMFLKDLLRKEQDTLIGLEYLIYIRDEMINPSSKFICCLCKKNGNYLNILQHLKSSIHKNNYLVSYLLPVTCNELIIVTLRITESTFSFANNNDARLDIL